MLMQTGPGTEQSLSPGRQAGICSCSQQHLGSDTQRSRIMVVLEGAELGFRKDLDIHSPV